MRVSTNEIFRTGLGALQSGQSELARTQQQLSTGKRILAPSDDASGSVQALQLRRGIAAMDQYARNADLATGRLEREETVLKQLGDNLQRVRELAVQAANATQTDDSRAAIAQELRQALGALVDAANTRDANGEYLFAGYRSASRPFVTNAAGEIEYLGDSGQRFVGLTPDRQIAVGDSGDAFMAVPEGNGVFIAAPDTMNTGSAWVLSTEVVDPSAITADNYTIQMTSATDYEVLDSTSTVIASGTYAEGQGIDIGGRRIVLAGTPATGDSFLVEPAGVRSLFETVGDLAAALEAPHASEADRARLGQSIGTALQNLDQALGRVLEMRTRVGARLNTIETQGLASDEHKLELQTSLSGVEDLDYAEAISRFSLQQTALEAAQQTFARISRLSLFDFIR